MVRPFIVASVLALAVPALADRGWREPISLERVVVVGPEAGSGARLAEALTGLGAEVVSLPPEDAVEAGGLEWTAEVLSRTAIVIGGIHSNRAMLPLYAHYLSFADADYPGDAGYTIRTVAQPFGAGTSAVALEASDAPGEAAAVARLLVLLDGGLVLPATLETHLAAEVDARARNVHHPGLRYALTGEEDQAAKAAESLLGEVDDETGWFRFGDYGIERWLREYHHVQDAPGTTPEQVARLDKGVLDTLVASEGLWWRRRDGRSIGGRHQTMGTSCFTAGVHLARRRFDPDGEARDRLDEWWSECRAYWENACSTFHDDLEGIPIYYCPQPVLDWALMLGVDGYAEEQLPRAIERALAVLDPLGCYAGTGTYEECRPGGLYHGLPWGWLLSAGAYFHPESDFAWLRANLPSTGTGTWAVSRDCVGFRCFATDTEPGVPAPGPRLAVTPLGEYRHTRLAHQPEGSAAWIGGDISRCFEKIAFRSGYGPDDQYFVLQGYTPQSADNQPPWDANSIIRYTDLGHVWLHSNSEKAGHLFRSAVYATDGIAYGTRAMGCELAARVAPGPRAEVAIVSSRLPGLPGCDWTRHIICKAGTYAVVVDEMRRTTEGDFGLTCTWRTPQQARLDADGMTAREGDASFRVVNADAARLSLEGGSEIEGAAVATLLRESQPLGETRTFFRNLIYATDTDHPRELEVRPVGESALMVRGTIDGEDELALIGVDVDAPGLELDGPGFVGLDVGVSPEGERPSTPATRDALQALWAASTTAARPVEEAVDGGQARRAWRAEPLSGLPPAAEAPVLNWDVEPSGSPVSLTDRVVTRYATASWPKGEDVALTADLRADQHVARVDLHVGADWGSNIIPADSAYPVDRVVRALFSSDGFTEDARERELVFACDATFENCHKGVVYPVKRWRCIDVGETARSVRLHFDADVWDRGLRLTEISLRVEGDSAAHFIGHVARDADGDGIPELIAWSNDAELVVLDANGDVALRKRMPGAITSADAYAELGEGEPRLLVTTREARLYCLTAAGEELWRVDFLDSVELNGDLPTGYSTGLMRADGEPVIVVGNYNLTTFVSPAGEVLKYQRLPAAYYTMMFARGADYDGDGAEEIAVADVWGDLSVLSADMAREAGIRAPKGRGVALEYWPGSERRALVCTETGVGIADLAAREFEWLQAVTPINDCVVAGGEIVLAKEDGAILAYNEAGELTRKALIGQPVRAIAAVGGRLVAAAPGRLLDVEDQSTLAVGEYHRLDALGSRLVAMGPGGVIDAFDLGD